MNTRANLATGLERLAQLGFNTIYPAVWQRGYTLYPSPIAQELTDAAVLPNSPFEGRDVLAEIVELAQPLKISVIPWFEYGLMLPPRSPIACRYPDLLSCDKQGNIQRILGANGHQDPNVWLNPCHDRVRKFIVDLIADVVNRYRVAGIQLDDHFAFPVELGYDSPRERLRQRFTQQLFSRANGLQWDEWRAGQLTSLLQDIVSSVKVIRRDCQISISPNPLDFSKRRYLVDWQKWCELGLVDELVLQVYRDRLDLFDRELAKPEVRAIQQKIPTLIGILTGLRTRSIDTHAIELQVNSINKRRFSGYACFFYETLFHERLTPHPVTRDLQQLSKIFNPDCC
jgi:uncharacterized lipoprotein YddW (UPF0748 family)